MTSADAAGVARSRWRSRRSTSAPRSGSTIRSSTEPRASIASSSVSVACSTWRERDLLFLLDELFGATDSVERRIGALGVLDELLDAGAPALVTTHDIDVARSAVEDPRVRAVHFEERIEAGRLVFDHRLQAAVASAGMRDLGFRIDSRPPPANSAVSGSPAGMRPRAREEPSGR